MNKNKNLRNLKQAILLHFQLVTQHHLQSKNNKIEASKGPTIRVTIMPLSKRRESTNKKTVYALEATNPMSQSQLFKKFSKVIKGYSYC